MLDYGKAITGSIFQIPLFLDPSRFCFSDKHLDTADNVFTSKDTTEIRYTPTELLWNWAKSLQGRKRTGYLVSALRCCWRGAILYYCFLNIHTAVRFCIFYIPCWSKSIQLPINAKWGSSVTRSGSLVFSLKSHLHFLQAIPLLSVFPYFCRVLVFFQRFSLVAVTFCNRTSADTSLKNR